MNFRATQQRRINPARIDLALDRAQLFSLANYPSGLYKQKTARPSDLLRLLIFEREDHAILSTVLSLGLVNQKSATSSQAKSGREHSQFPTGQVNRIGATVFALNGIEDHVHMVASIPPSIAVAKFIGQIKAVASTKFNKAHPDSPPFFWQEEYGVFSFDAKRLPNYVAYVNRQKEHHAQGTIIPVLERTDPDFPRLMHEEVVTYTVETDEWRRELMALESARR